VYAEIGREVESLGLDSVNSRATVSRRRKLVLMGRAAASMVFAPGHPMDLAADPGPVRAVRFLVDAAAVDALPAHTFMQRTVRVLAMMDRQGERRCERFQATQARPA
jgi:15-cis-phytoene synthase